MSVRSPRLQLADLGKPAVLPLSLRDVEMLAAKWGGPESRRGRAWRDIETLADLFLKCDRSEPEALRHAWHHLLLAVGNFKRSAGMISPPSLRSTPLPARPVTCQIPTSATGALPLERDKPATWRNLTRVEGLGTPTATTLLSALWPGSHAIIDVRTLRAAIGLTASAAWAVSGLDRYDLPERSPAAQYWRLYSDWYLPTVVQTALSLDCPKVSVERALFYLDGRVVKGLKKLEKLKKTPWVWTGYRPAAERWIADSAPSWHLK